MLRLKSPVSPARTASGCRPCEAGTTEGPKRIVVERVVTGDVWNRHAVTETTTIDGIQHDLYAIIARETKRLLAKSSDEGLDGSNQRALKMLTEAFNIMRIEEVRSARLQMDQDAMMTLDQARSLLAQGAGTLKMLIAAEEDNGSDDATR